ncbi:low molecular weight protein-tyrosine-phosphatase [Parasphingopyxis sp.]|uniref:low molecular weight protein-tyrosine-phosphatase n=1 Tax=Parasphingopyxis sp. TaxID=1920299 RepID=UPI002623F071|nr:low molecular weight protein-tyrosine-phosphatase [Parasphingopyxis sp.]
MAQSILFVCLGNICRSPLAEGALQAAARDGEATLEIDSAGTGSWHVGHPPDGRARAVALANGVDIGAQRARQVRAADFDMFDHIVAMDRSVLNDLKALQPSGSSARLSLFLDHVAGREGEDVTDPYYGEDEGFATTWDDVTKGAEALLAAIIRS